MPDLVSAGVVGDELIDTHVGVGEHCGIDLVADDGLPLVRIRRHRILEAVSVGSEELLNIDAWRRALLRLREGSGSDESDREQER